MLPNQITTTNPGDLLTHHAGWTDEQFKAQYGQMWESMKEQDTFLRLPIEEQSRIRQQQVLAYEESKTALAKIKTYAEMEEIQKRFIRLLGDAAGRAYVESIVIAVSRDEKLQQCTPKSIMVQAMRAASLGLSVDPILEQAHLVAYGKEATLIPDYHGLVNLSVNTNYYEIPPNVSEVYQGEIVKIDRFTGKVTITGERVSNVVIGWCGYFRAKNGTERYLYMTNEECDKHGSDYNPGGYNNPKSPWNAHNERDRGKMRRKTVLRTLVRRWGNFSPIVQSILARADQVIEADLQDFPADDNIIIPTQDEQADSHHQSAEANLRELGYS
jgi:recombination protein RecT